MIKYAQKPNADVEYFTSAIIRDALDKKFEKLFGRDPVAVEIDDANKVEDTRIPDMVAESVNPQIASMLKASAIEASNPEAEIPAPPNSTLLYKIVDENPAEISLESIPEYAEIEESAREATISAVAAQDDINIIDGIAYVSGITATINIGIYVDNTKFASEFQYELQQAGGDDLAVEEKEQVFDALFTSLPGGSEEVNESVRTNLLEVVGLTGAIN